MLSWFMPLSCGQCSTSLSGRSSFPLSAIAWVSAVPCPAFQNLIIFYNRASIQSSELTTLLIRRPVMSLKQHVVSNSMLIFSRQPMSGNMPSGSPAEIFTHGSAHRFNILYVFKNSVNGVLTTWLNSSATAVSVVLASSTGFNAAIFFWCLQIERS